MSRAKLDAFRTNLGAASVGCVIKNGYLAYSWGNIAANFDWASASKPVVSTMLFAAIHEGRVASPDNLLLPYWPGLRTGDQTMTFRHLANMISGYACNDRDGNGNALPPGSRWAYNDYAIMLYVKTLDKVFGTADHLVTAGNQRFVVPLQFQDGVLFNSSKGRVRASARDFARIGWFWLNRGNWNGNQLLPDHFFGDYLKADVPFGTPRTTNSAPDDYLGVGSYGGGINQHDGPGIYGFNWWFNLCLTVPPRDPPLLAWPSAPADTYIASGHFGRESLAIIPSLGLVVAAYNPNVASWGDTVITDPPNTNATLNYNLKLLAETALPQPTPAVGVIHPNADVCYSGGAINAWSQSQQINWGLAGSGGLETGSRRSYLEFTLGTNPVASAKFKLYNYWGGPPVNGQGRLPEALTRLKGTLVNRPIRINEPPPNTANDPTWVPPDNTNFVNIGSDVRVGPAVGWYEWDITDWYNQRLGQTTTLAVRASATSGYDFPLYEDREGTACAAGAGGTGPNTGPRIEFVLPPPSFISVSNDGGRLVMRGHAGLPGSHYYLLGSSNSTLPPGGWARLATNQFDAEGRFSVTNPINPVAPREFFRLAIP